jgi:hypothetical protein
MVIRYLHLVWSVISPNETNPILLINANTMLASPISLQCFQPIAGRKSKFLQRFYRIQLIELSRCNSPQLLGAGPASYC